MLSAERKFSMIYNSKTDTTHAGITSSPKLSAVGGQLHHDILCSRIN